MFVSLETFPIARATLNDNLMRMSVCGQECLFCERHNCRIYPDNRGIYWLSRSPTIRLIYFRLKSVGHILIMRFRYGMCMCIGGSMRDNGSFVRIDVIIQITKIFFGTKNRRSETTNQRMLYRWTAAYYDRNMQQN